MQQLLTQNLEEFSHSFTLLNGRHIETVELLSQLPLRYDLVYFAAIDTGCFDTALTLVKQYGLFILEEHSNYPALADDLIALLAKQRTSFEMISRTNGQLVLRKL